MKKLNLKEKEDRRIGDFAGCQQETQIQISRNKGVEEADNYNLLHNLLKLSLIVERADKT